MLLFSRLAVARRSRPGLRSNHHVIAAGPVLGLYGAFHYSYFQVLDVLWRICQVEVGLRGCFRPPLRPSISILVRFLRFAGGAGCWGSYHPVAVMLVHLPVLICESSFESSSVSRNMQPQWTGHFISPATGTPYPQAPSLGSTVWLPGGQTLFIFFARSERHGVSARRYERCRNGASQKPGIGMLED